MIISLLKVLKVEFACGRLKVSKLCDLGFRTLERRVRVQE
jgi:hypothetical protein